MTGPTVLVRRDGAIGEIVLNRPDKLNALSLELVRDLAAAVEELAGDPDLRVVVVRGAGRAFCAGLDLDMVGEQGMPPDFFPVQERAFTALERLPAIVIAQIHGHCLGGGLQLALACDIRIARADARLGLPAALEGLVPGAAPWRLPRFVGMGRAMRLAVLGTPVDAREALDIGLVDHLLPDEDFAALATELAQRYAGVPARAAAGVKELVRSAFDVTFDDSYRRTREIIAECERSADARAAKELWAARRSEQ
ncbi:enoyl-CoA hydratase/isomerase family protein [Actinophytocola sp.]|uniref:enoyl-CoA hydratase/isomerase family protein n=1 Tax=Actinophytocola sp. TaxID=1872138 RepID=UPI002D7F357B|nr:enoyl-CoA hydratase/isomerase family protein [Actinophytocola sp.]HET9139583.1 enoyl-CoA hydratase/isomerase family protein [Actinophytocola sp.]